MLPARRSSFWVELPMKPADTLSLAKRNQAAMEMLVNEPEVYVTGLLAGHAPEPTSWEDLCTPTEAVMVTEARKLKLTWIELLDLVAKVFPEERKAHWVKRTARLWALIQRSQA